MPEERRQNLAEADKGSYDNEEEWLDEFLDDKGAFYNGIESDDSVIMMRIIMKIEEQFFADVLRNRCS